MINKYIEVEQTRDGWMITDWTQWFQCHLENNHYRELAQYSSQFIAVQGSEITYHIKGFKKSVELSKQFAVWYHVTKASGNISKYRLDFSYSKRAVNK